MGDLDGVTCFCELAVPLASRLCERLGLATNSPQVGAGLMAACMPFRAPGPGWQAAQAIWPLQVPESALWLAGPPPAQHAT